MANYILLDRIELNASASSVTFSNIPQTGYTDLKVVASTRTATGGAADILVQFNSDSTSGNYSERQLQGNGASASSGTGNQQSATSSGSTDTASTFASSEIYIPNYTGSTQKSFSTDTVTENNATTAYATLRAGLWTGTAAISGMTFTHNGGASFAAGSTFSLYGVAALGTTPTIAPKADGGNVIATDGTYWYHAFLSNGTFTPQTGLTCDILTVAGGGAGGSSYGQAAGGGAGGLVYLAAQSVTATNYAITVGAGGASNSTMNGPNGSNGSNSGIAGFTTALGGGGGASYRNNGGASPAGSSGGSGGGGGANSGGPSGGAGGAGTSGQGNNGGNGYGSGTWGGGGGGGAGAVGANALGGSTGGYYLGGSGGDGLSTYSSWGVATNTGENISSTRWYAGGGGGAEPNGTTAGMPGKGNGAANTGGGGSYGGSTGNSGIVIIRYTVAF